ncbi:large ribosomal subunit protein bL27-like [Liolophura sinensis]|uniref:large ribosomal subunit protein bL27-like n=1 Tax=Liolophura sinensis TaxID=3198878 RepID=UPI003159107A
MFGSCQSILKNIVAIPAGFDSQMWQSVRCASKKAGGSTKNMKGRTIGKRRGWKRQDGQFVHAGEILVRQLGLRYYPGQYVRAGFDNTLTALEDGQVIVTCEKLSPYPDSPLYEPVSQGLTVYKKFFHVLPVPQHGKFKLVSQV